MRKHGILSMKKEITFDNYIAMCDRHEKLDFQCGSWWPSINDVKTKLEPKLEQNLEFLIWVSETANPPQTEEEKASQRYINELLKKTLVFIDTDIIEVTEEGEVIRDEIDE